MEKENLFDMESVFNFFSNFNLSKFSFDTETSSLRYTDLEITGMSFCDGKIACYIPINSSLNKSKIKCVEHKELFEFLEDIVFPYESDKRFIIAQNLPFDGMVVSKYGISLNNAKMLFDTMTAAHLFDENLESKGLKYLTRNLLGKKVTEFKEVGNNHYSTKFFDYGCEDAINTWLLYEFFRDKLVEKGLKSLMKNIESPFQKCLIEMKVEGVDIDKKLMEETTLSLRANLMDIEKEMYDTLGEKYFLRKDLFGNTVGIKGNYNFSSPNQLSNILFKKLKLEVIETTPTGLPKTGKITIQKYRGIPFVECLNRYKICSKLLSAFFEPLPGHIQKDGRIRPNFNNIGARTGRLSSSNPNCQQLPNVNKDFPIETRACFTVPKGYKMFSCDFSGQELRLLAHITNEPSMIEAFNDGMDLHLVTANKLFILGLDKIALTNGTKEHDDAKEKYHDERYKAKVINFAISYGISKYGLSKQLDTSEEEAQDIINKFFEGYPIMKTKMNNTHTKVKALGHVKNLFGRYRHFSVGSNGKYPPGAFRESFNYIIQGSASDMIRIASNKCYTLAKENPEWDLKMIMTVHDEVVFKVKEEFVEIASGKVKECFENCVKLSVPVLADIGIGDNYSSAK